MTGRGIKINYIYYWCEAFRETEVEGCEVAVRYDPYDLSRAYAYVRSHWHQCRSEHFLQFQNRTERELKIAATEMRRRRQQHGQRLVMTAHRLADFLSSVEADEAALQQRLRDGEVRRSKERIKAAARKPEKSRATEQGEAGAERAAEKTETYFPGAKTYDPGELEIYEEY